MTVKRPRIAVLTGYWSTNVGNAFFQLGAEWALRQIMPDAQIVPIGDQPGYPKLKAGNPANAIDYVKHLELDGLVLLGPYCRPEMENLTAEMLRTQHAKGCHILVLAAGMMAYDDAMIELSRRLMKQFRPTIFTSRDRETFDAIGDIAEASYDGIDVATFVSDLHEPLETDLPEYYALNFDQIPEPRIGPESKIGPAGKGDRSFEMLDGTPWVAKQPAWRTELAYKARPFLFLDAGLGLHGRLPNEVDGRLVVRTDHRYNPLMLKKIYKGPMTYAGDVPYSYLNIYANSTCTFTNRVHAAVATLSFGRPAMLFTRSPRAFLLSRLGATTVTEKPTVIDMDVLRDEKRKMLDWLREQCAALGWATV